MARCALRKVWDDIIPGAPRQTQPYLLTKDAIQLYCRSVGEDHPLYFDEFYAKKSTYGGLIAPPSIHILLMFACSPADDWMRTPGTVNAGQSWSYNSGAAGRHHYPVGTRARQIHPPRAPFRCPRQGLLQPARRRDLLRSRANDPADVSGEKVVTHFDELTTGDTIEGPHFAVTRESIRLFCDGSLDYNPLHLDDDYMKNSFGKTNFRGIIMRGMNNFGLITRMLTDWAYARGAIHRQLETRWLKPVKPGDTIQPTGIIKAKQTTQESQWIQVDVMVKNQRGEQVATGEAMLEFPQAIAA